MANDKGTKQSLPERIKERLRDVAGEWLEAVDSMFRPEPALIPIPIRNNNPPRRYR